MKTQNTAMETIGMIS
jgi:hypothetical protein